MNHVGVEFNSKGREGYGHIGKMEVFEVAGQIVPLNAKQMELLLLAIAIGEQATIAEFLHKNNTNLTREQVDTFVSCFQMSDEQGSEATEADGEVNASAPA